MCGLPATSPRCARAAACRPSWRPTTKLDPARLRALDPAADLAAVEAALRAFDRACREGPLAEQALGERFRWLTATRSATVQPGPVHAGLTEDPAAALDRLFGALVTSP